MTKTAVYIFLFDGFSDWEISYLTPELKKSEKIDLKYFSVDGKSIVSMGGLNINPDFSLNQVNAGQISALILPGGSLWENNTIGELNALIETLNVQNKTIGAICGATICLAQIGYLDKIRHTSNALAYLQNFAKNYKGKANYTHELVTSDKNVITANGIGPIEFACEIFKKLEVHSEKDIEKWFQLFKNGVWQE